MRIFQTVVPTVKQLEPWADQKILCLTRMGCDADAVVLSLPNLDVKWKVVVGMKICTTYTANIYVGFRVRYTERVHDIEEVRAWLKEFCNAVGFCVTITPTEYIYTHNPESGCIGYEPGCIIGIINYPRFPAAWTALRGKAIHIAQALLKLCEQGKVTVVFPDETVMVEADEQ